MYREKRPAKYLEDLNVYTKRQIKILYFNGYGRDPTDKELKDLLAKPLSSLRKGAMKLEPNP